MNIVQLNLRATAKAAILSISVSILFCRAEERVQESSLSVLAHRDAMGVLL